MEVALEIVATFSKASQNDGDNRFSRPSSKHTLRQPVCGFIGSETKWFQTLE
jgi:hypothetical protein